MFWNALGTFKVFQIMKYTYILVNFFTIIIPFIFSFHPRLQFYKTWRAFFPAVFITGLFFVLWDNYFTGLGIWGFNKQYVSGIFLGNLPLGRNTLLSFAFPTPVFTPTIVLICFLKTGRNHLMKANLHCC